MSNSNDTHALVIEEEYTHPQNEISQNQDFDSIYIFDRTGIPKKNVPAQLILNTFETEMAKSLDLFYNTFSLVDNVYLAQVSNEDHSTGQLVEQILKTYIFAKLVLADTRTRNRHDELRLTLHFTIFNELFQTLLKEYSKQHDQTFTLEYLKTILSLGFVLLKLSEMLQDVDSLEQEKISILLAISLAPVDHIRDAFKDMIPPVYQSFLFIFSFLNDISALEAIKDLDTEQAAKLRLISDLALKRYGTFFLNYSGNALFSFLSVSDIFDCPQALLTKASHGTSTIQTVFGSEFSIEIIKYQWEIIKIASVITADPTISLFSILEEDCEFAFEQNQQLFLYSIALLDASTQETNRPSNFVASKLKQVLFELTEHIERLCAGLNENYNIIHQNEKIKFSPQDQAKLLQLVKLNTLLLTICLCVIQIVLTGPMMVVDIPVISPVIDLYISKSDFTEPLKMIKLKLSFKMTFIQISEQLYTSYSMFNTLSTTVKEKLTTKDKDLIFNMDLSWGLIILFLTSVISMIISSYCGINAFIQLMDDL